MCLIKRGRRGGAFMPDNEEGWFVQYKERNESLLMTASIHH